MSCSSLATPIGQRSPSGMKYQWKEDVEDLEGHHVGGYHPVYLQDECSDGRYRIVHKLGCGIYSIV